MPLQKRPHQRRPTHVRSARSTSSTLRFAGSREISMPRAIECSCSCASSTIVSVGTSGAFRIAPNGSRGAVDYRSGPRARRCCTAHALRHLPAISAAFADGRLSYSKVRALTRAAHEHDEDLLLAYALQATAAQVEERCRQIRNSEPESAERAQRTWERRSLSVWCSPSQNMATIRVELSREEAELIQKALDRAVEAGEVATGAEFDGNRWRAQQVDALVSIAKAYLAGGTSESTSASDHYQVVVHVDETALRGKAGRSDLPVETIRRLTCDGSVITVVEDERGNPLDVGRSSVRFLRRSNARYWRAIAAARSRVATASASSTLITFAIGRTAATRVSTIRRSSARSTISYCTRAVSQFTTITVGTSTSSARMVARFRVSAISPTTCSTSPSLWITLPRKRG
jgi:Domain of unknown function (DUF222)